MSRFNKHLSQLEAIFEVAEPVLKPADPIHVSDFIHHVFENSDAYGLEGLDKEWFCSYTSLNESNATNFINNLLQGDGHLINKPSITEGISNFIKDEKNG